jgi:hypothetical protein
MESVTLNETNWNVISLKKELDEIRDILKENELELADDLEIEINESRKRPNAEFISQEQMKKEFGND